MNLMSEFLDLAQQLLKDDIELKTPLEKRPDFKSYRVTLVHDGSKVDANLRILNLSGINELTRTSLTELESKFISLVSNPHPHIAKIYRCRLRDQLPYYAEEVSNDVNCGISRSRAS